MSTARFFKTFLFCGITFLPLLSHAQTPETAATTSVATEEEKIDQVIEDAKKALEDPAPATPPVLQKDESKIEATDENGGKAIVTLAPGSKSVKTAPQAKVITSKAKDKPKLAKKAAKKTNVAQNSPKSTSAPAKGAPKRYAKATTKPAHPTGSTGPLSAFELGRYQYCGEDRDCMFAVNGCCDCANGSEDVSVNRERLEAFRARFSCLYVACGDKSHEPACGTGIVSCVNHKCRYFTDAAVDEAF